MNWRNWWERRRGESRRVGRVSFLSREWLPIYERFWICILVASNRQRRRPHTLDPQSLYLAHLSPYLHQVQQELQAKLGETQAQNEQLAKGIESQREEVERLVGGLEAVMSDLEGANTVMGKAVEEGQIKREILDVDGEL